ncbi:hypothetical protein M501DRAFT_954699 [Patellaria atrata CBS 101060]|uniref:Uncharacterized protein n=1 Tax=Patellaria atrata CBS 101060 TaxID=1346257 RepID=A0A9P4SB25_9PEZI|nr:hypothetical protein M501DRAFT_954699 [Patellaria atrata CBS 101060]
MQPKYRLDETIYSHLYPNPKPSDPQNFTQFLQKHLVAEVRIETSTFYGSLETVEARYPGLNYSHPPHRKRLGRFPHHARLFQAFNDLGVTESEIQRFCRWEGTLWARQRYERDENTVVRDTTGDEIGPWVDRRKREAKIQVKTDIEVEFKSMDEDEDEEDEDTPLSSVGLALNNRLIAAAAAREQGIDLGLDDPEFEQYLKEQAERGILPASTLLGLGLIPRPVNEAGSGTMSAAFS